MGLKKSAFMHSKDQLPYLGIGLGLRREIASETLRSDKIDWLEIVPENYMRIGGHARRRLAKARAKHTIVTHGVNLSIGCADPLDQNYLDDLKALLDYIDAPWFSDHLCFTSFESDYMHELLPLPLTEQAALHVADRAKRVQEFCNRPFLLENISYYMDVPGSEMQEASFFARVVERADCGILLDVNNVYVNSINLNFDPYVYLAALPLERVVQIHVAGHSHTDTHLIDTHGAPIIEPVFELLQHVLERCDAKAVMLERDQNFPDFVEIENELDIIRKMVESTYSCKTARNICDSTIVNDLVAQL